MKPKTLGLMAVAVVCGLAASYMTSRLLAERNNTPQAEEEKIQVLVAKQKIPLGTLIKEPEKYFVFKAYTKGEDPKKGLHSMDLVKDRRLNKPLTEEQFVTAEDLMDPKQAGLDSLLPPGMRAIALKVNPASVVGGFVLPSTRVDVVTTVRSGDESYTQTILQNMLVLATDMQYQRDGEKTAMMSSVVTLAAKPEDAQRLRLAEAMGDLSLTLRSAEDEEILRAKPTRPRDVQRTADGSIQSSEDPTAGPPAPALGGIPDVPATRVETAAKAPEIEVEVPKPPETITQVIHNGESVTKTVYVVNKDGDFTTKVEKTGLESEARPERRPTRERERDSEKEAKPTEPEKASAGGEKKEREPSADKTDGKKR